MEIVIINKEDSTISCKDESKLLWIAALLGKRIFYITDNAHFLYYYAAKNDISSRHWIDMTKSIYEMIHHEVKSEEIEQLYQNYLFLKKLKHKRQPEIAAMLKFEHLLKKMKTDCSNYFEININHLRYDALIPFTGIGPKDTIVPVPWANYGPSSKSKSKIKLVSEIWKADMAVPIFAKNIENFAHCIDLKSLATVDVNQDNSGLYRLLLLELPPLFDLSSQQIEILRKILTEPMRQLTERLQAMRKDMEPGLDFQPFLCDQYQSFLLPLVKKLSELIDDQAGFPWLNAKNETNEKWQVYLCFCRIEDVLDFYCRSKIVEKNEAIYIRENLSCKPDSGAVFLYSKPFAITD